MDVSFAMNFMIVPGMLVCSSFLNSACMFIMSKSLLISSATVFVRTVLCVACLTLIMNCFGYGCYFVVECYERVDCG